MARRRPNVFSLAFLDAMTCGFGAVVLFYMVITASVGVREGRMTSDRQGEVDRLEVEVLERFKNLVEVRNAVRETDDRLAVTRGLSRRLIETLQEIQVELATYSEDTTARQEQVNKLKSDLKSLEEETRRLAASRPSEETPGDRVRQFVGDGDRQYLTGLKVGGSRILILLDASASMLDQTIVNVIRTRNLDDSRKRRADKWQQAVRTVDWLTTQLPRESRFQIYAFAEEAGAVVADTEGEWLDSGDREVLDDAVERVRRLVPNGGTNLYRAFQAVIAIRPRADNLVLITDGLPTMGKSAPGRSTVTGKQRLRYFGHAVDALPSGVPINVILLPMEGDPMAASAFWKLAVASNGSFLAPARDWP